LPENIRIPWVGILPRTSFSSHLTMDTLSLASGW